MKTTAKIFICILFLVLGVKAHSQTYVKMNALYAAVGVINPQVESVISSHSSMAIDITASPWRRWNGNHSQFLILLGEYRYYFKHAAQGWYVSANAAMMGFDLNRLQFFKGKFISRQSDYGKGFGVAAGVGFGWQHSLSERWCVICSFRLIECCRGIIAIVSREISICIRKGTNTILSPIHSMLRWRICL